MFGGSQVDKFEQVHVWCGNTRTSLWTDRQREWLTDRHDWKHCLPATPLAGGKNGIFVGYQYTHQDISWNWKKSPVLLYWITVCVAGIKGGLFFQLNWLFPLRSGITKYNIGLMTKLHKLCHFHSKLINGLVHKFLQSRVHPILKNQELHLSCIGLR